MIQLTEASSKNAVKASFVETRSTMGKFCKLKKAVAKYNQLSSKMWSVDCILRLHHR